MTDLKNFESFINESREKSLSIIDVVEHSQPVPVEHWKDEQKTDPEDRINNQKKDLK